jgi:hypothetical protein
MQLPDVEREIVDEVCSDDDGGCKDNQMVSVAMSRFIPNRDEAIK